MVIKKILSALRAPSKDQKEKLNTVSKFLSQEDSGLLEKYLKERKIKVEEFDIPYSERIASMRKYTQIRPLDEKIRDKIDVINKKLIKKLEDELVQEFSKKAWETIPSILAPQIIGFDDIKKAIALQLFSKEQFHMLLIGDPGVGKTDLIRAAEPIAPISSFGLGSGTSAVGLTVTIREKQIKEGLLPLANNGIALIDELNLLKREDRGGLYNVMEKGFLTYDKGGEHLKFDAKCSILATANPNEGKIKGATLADIKKQLPFDSALLSRFHLIFLIREHNVEEFMQVTDGVLSKKEKINENDLEFIKNYVKKALEIKPELTDKFNEMIKKFIKEIKEQEGSLLIDVTPRFIIGLSRLIEASARMELRDKIQKEDVWRAIETFSMAMKSITFKAV